MSNLFMQNLDQSQIDAKNALKRNIAFAQRICEDVQATFNLQSEPMRASETKQRFFLFEKYRRAGFGFTLEATTEGVSFSDNFGLSCQNIALMLGVSIKNEYENKQKNVDDLSKALESLNGRVGFTGNQGCCDHYHLSLVLNDTDSNLNDKIKLIIKVLRDHGVTTRL